MSIQSEITRISGNVSDAFTAITNKGVTVPAGSTSDDLADLISQISGGGGGGAISIVDTPDAAGGTVRTITAVDISSDTVTAAHLETGYTAHDAEGNPITGTLSPGGGGGLEYETGTYTPVSDVAADQVTISFANSHTEVPIFIVIVDQTGTYDATTNTQYYWNYVNHYVLFGNPLYFNTTSAYYAQGYNRLRATSTTSMNGNAINYTSQSDSKVSNENFKPYYNSSTYYRSGRTYKWIAVWKPST